VKIRRFVAKDMRTALSQIKEELGADAVIMSNKKIPEGVELMAAVDYHQTTATNTSENSTASNEIPQSEIGESFTAHPPGAGIEAPMAQTPIAQNQIAQRNIQSGQMPNSELKNDTVSIGAEVGSITSSLAKANAIDSAVPPPSDSLAALLGRQIQQPTDNVVNQNLTTDKNQIPVNDLEQQLKNFTDRLEHASSPSDMLPQANQANQSNHNEQVRINNQTQQGNSSSASQISNTHSEQGQSQPNVNSQEFEQMQKEMASIRQLLEHQVSGLMWQDVAQKDPARAMLANRLMTMGITENIADQVAGYVPHQMNEQDAWQYAQKLITQQLNTTKNDIIHRGGVVSLVGPTGVGKTTTIAKLAARFAQIHGADQVAMISTDSYRIAGFEQLATYGKIIGCQVKLAKDAQSLDGLLQQYSDKKLVLIDTAGMGQRDMRLAQHLTTLMSNARVRIRNYLVLAANTQQNVMQENVERFKKVPLVGCIYTKLDESLSVGEIISTSIQNGLPIGYLTDGQRVPEDIKVANAEKLVRLADKMANKSVNKQPISWRPLPTQTAMVM